MLVDYFSELCVYNIRMNFSLRWNAPTEIKRVRLFNVVKDDIVWKPSKITAEYTCVKRGEEKKVITFECNSLIIQNICIVSLTHNDKHVLSIILSIDPNDEDILIRVGHWDKAGVFLEEYYEELEGNDQSYQRIVWDVDEFSDSFLNV